MSARTADCLGTGRSPGRTAVRLPLPRPAARPPRGAGKLRQGAAGGRRAAHAKGTARRPESRAESIGCVDVRGSRAGFLNERFTRDNFRYQEQCCQPKNCGRGRLQRPPAAPAVSIPLICRVLSAVAPPDPGRACGRAGRRNRGLLLAITVLRIRSCRARGGRIRPLPRRNHGVPGPPGSITRRPCRCPPAHPGAAYSRSCSRASCAAPLRRASSRSP